MLGQWFNSAQPDRISEMEKVAKLLRTVCTDDEPSIRRAKQVLMEFQLDGRKVTLYYDAVAVIFLLEAFPDMRTRVENLYTHPQALQVGDFMSRFGVWYTIPWGELSAFNRAVPRTKFVRLGDWLARSLRS